MGIVLNAALQVSPHPDPLTSTGHFLSPAEPGPVSIEVDLMKPGRTVSTLTATLSQAGRRRLVVLTTTGDLDRQEGPSRVLGPPPSFSTDLVSSHGRPSPHPIAERFEYLLPPAQAQVAAGISPPPEAGPIEGDPAMFEGKIRFADGTEPPITALPLLVDAYPPAVFNLGLYGWTPTLELTVHARGRPRGSWHLLRVSTRHLIQGLLEEDAELWSTDGGLVAQSRQLARVLEPAP
jgi:hypothetical protein